MPGERTITRDAPQAQATDRWFGEITASVAADDTIDCQQQRYDDAGAVTDTDFTYTVRNATGNAITVSGSKRVFVYWDTPSQQWLIDGYVC